jgi:dihydroorotate dehydrogenase (NAD+) catalytic subunit
VTAKSDNPLAIDLAGVPLASPLIAASGTAGYADELFDVARPHDFGAITCKSITVEERAGNETWRIIPINTGMMNAIGLANVGVKRFLDEVLPRVREAGVPIFGSVAGGAVEEYIRVAAAMDGAAALPIIELNISCPNTDDGRLFGDSPELTRELIAEVRPAVKQAKLFVKLPPSTSSLVPLAAAAIEAGADGLTICNTVPGLALDVETRQPRIARGVGGVSGPAIHPLAVRLVADVHQGLAREAGVPIIGVGGVIRWQHAAEFILAGATAVGLGTALFADPRIPRRVARGLRRWVKRQGATCLGDLVGKAEL